MAVSSVEKILVLKDEAQSVACEILWLIALSHLSMAEKRIVVEAENITRMRARTQTTTETYSIGKKSVLSILSSVRLPCLVLSCLHLTLFRFAYILILLIRKGSQFFGEINTRPAIVGEPATLLY
jgi:hypothetical protein